MGCGRSRPEDEEDDAPQSKGKAKKKAKKKATGASGSNAGGPKASLSKAAHDATRYTNPESIFEALGCKVGEHHPVKLVRMSYILRGFGREQTEGSVGAPDLPSRAFVGADELRQVWTASGHGGVDLVLPVFSVSCGWETPEHPDPQGMHLAVIRKALKKQKKELQTQRGQFTGFSEVGVFWDWASLLQGDGDSAPGPISSSTSG
ncbi:unnamed protein product, partial [Prorocentrum cordatum]